LPPSSHTEDGGNSFLRNIELCRTTRKTVPFTATAFITSDLTTISLIYSFFPCSAAAQRWPGPPHSQGSYTTHNDAP